MACPSHTFEICLPRLDLTFRSIRLFIDDRLYSDLSLKIIFQKFYVNLESRFEIIALGNMCNLKNFLHEKFRYVDYFMSEFNSNKVSCLGQLI